MPSSVQYISKYIFYFIKDTCIASYADDNRAYATNRDITNLLKTLESETNMLFHWFTMNEMKPNADECHILVANQNDKITVKLGAEEISNDQSVDLLGIKIYKNLNFSKLTKLCKKGNQ